METVRFCPECSCEVCGNSPHKSAHDREIQLARLHHYRHALHLACGDDKEKIRHFMRLAEDERVKF